MDSKTTPVTLEQHKAISQLSKLLNKATTIDQVQTYINALKMVVGDYEKTPVEKQPATIFIKERGQTRIYEK